MTLTDEGSWLDTLTLTDDGHTRGSHERERERVRSPFAFGEIERVKPKPFSKQGRVLF